MAGYSFEISGKLIDIRNRRIYNAILSIEYGRITHIREVDQEFENYVLPGFIDAHVHIESSMLIPSEFAREAVKHGTIASVSDPHEIANVCGIEGIRFMIDNGSKVPFQFYFGAPSCVPATPFESSGSTLGPAEVAEILSWDEIQYLAEMMNYPGVLNNDPQVMAKINAAKAIGKPIDGHAPGLTGNDAKDYFDAGISTDHECFNLAEARQKAAMGMKILIREGSAARNFDNLLPLLNEFPAQIMFCSDDKHPDDLLKGHINLLVKRALKKGYDLFDVLAACTLNPKEHYNLQTGVLRPGDNADFIVVNNLKDFAIKETYIGGLKVFDGTKVDIASIEETPLNNFNISPLQLKSLQVNAKSNRIKVIDVIDGEIITRKLQAELQHTGGLLQSDTKQDILKIVVVNRYNTSPPAIAFVHNFGLQSGALASTIAHDSHNIIAVGVSDEELLAAINHLIEIKGGICAMENNTIKSLQLPVAGLMSLKPALEVALQYKELDRAAKALGCKLQSPFMTLAFMSLLVIPELKIGDKGLFDGNTFSFTSLVAD